MTLRNYPEASIWWRGRYWPVTEHFHAETSAIWPELHDMDWETVDAERRRLINLSDQRTLTDEEKAKRRAYTRHWNLRSSINFLEGRDCRDFGWSEYDICHGVRFTFDCGCVLHGVFHHYDWIKVFDKTAESDTVGLHLDIHPHYPRNVCSTHSHLRGDLTALAQAVFTDSTLLKDETGEQELTRASAISNM